MRVLIASIITLAGLTGCQQQSDGKASPPAGNQEQPAQLMYLSCKGTATEPNKLPYQQTRLIGVPASDKTGEHLVEYKETERLFYKICPSSLYDCGTEISDDLIREQGAQRGSTGSDQSWFVLLINRRTGRVSQQDSLGVNVTSAFEGTCTVAQPPTEEPAKF